jgi:hypothetical protein
MNRRSVRPSVRSRVTLAAGVTTLAVVAMAARMPAAQQPAKAAAPAMAMPAPADTQKAKTDSAAATDTTKKADSTMAGMAGMSGMTMAMPMPAPAKKTGPGGWPVDPVTGQTLVNGTPVVGRVFVQQHTDGTVKIASVASALAVEPPHPMAPIVKQAYKPAPAQYTRRMRGIMIQATLWDMDHKKSARRDRWYKATTSGASLGQR